VLVTYSHNNQGKSELGLTEVYPFPSFLANIQPVCIILNSCNVVMHMPDMYSTIKIIQHNTHNKVEYSTLNFHTKAESAALTASKAKSGGNKSIIISRNRKLRYLSKYNVEEAQVNTERYTCIFGFPNATASTRSFPSPEITSGRSYTRPGAVPALYYGRS
jgi:hypothetical protein